MYMNLYDLYGFSQQNEFIITHKEFDNFYSLEEPYSETEHFFDKDNDIILFFSMTINDAKDKYYSLERLLAHKYDLDCCLITETGFFSFANKYVRIGVLKISNNQINNMLKVLYSSSFSAFCVNSKKNIVYELSKRLIDILQKNMFSWKSVLDCCKIILDNDASFIHICVANDGFSLNRLQPIRKRQGKKTGDG